MNLDKYTGKIIDNRYRIEKVIGRGGMAIVFEAVDLVMKRVVALKVLKDDISKDPQAVKRFINESKAISMLSHPNIVSIYDVSVKGDLKYIVMERVEGITLKNYINRKGALSCREALIYTQQILRALEHAHEKGIIHRDIKPQNIMLLKNGMIKVTDFGIAKLPNAETVTVADKAIGTVYYISPEQASGKKIDPRTDIYSLGIVMYEMLTGDLPFKADSPVSVALKQINDPPPHPSKKIHGIPTGAEQIILTAMEKNPDKRFQTAAAMNKHVSQILANPSHVFTNRKLEAVAAPRGLKGIASNIKEKIKKRPKRKKSSMLPVIAGISSAFIIVLIISLIFIISGLFKDDNVVRKEITVQNYINQVYSQDLYDQLVAEGYNIKIEKKYDANTPENTVIKQDPVAGSKRIIIEGRQKCDLTLTVSIGTETFSMPDFAIQDYRIAEIELEKYDIIIRREYKSHDLISDGIIIETFPKAGESVNAGQIVYLYISTGPNIINAEMPNLIGKESIEVMDILSNAKLNLGSISYEYSDQPIDTVIKQSYPEGTMVAQGTKVSIVLSQGPAATTAPETTAPPLPLSVLLNNYVGSFADDAINSLSELNLRYTLVYEYNDQYAEGYIFQTSPEAGTSVIPSNDVTEGTMITLYISRGIAPATP